MPSFKYTEIPPFTKREEDALLFNADGYLEYYIPEDYFSTGKSTSASIEGSYIDLMGSFNYRIYDEKGNPGKLMNFNFLTKFTCKPSRVDKKKDIILDEGLDPSDYRILHFEKGDQLITRLHVPKNIDNVSELLRLHIQTGRIPNTIDYNTLYKYPYEVMANNSGNYAVHSQAMGLIYSKSCVDPEDPSTLFRMSKAINKSMHGYKVISIREAAKYISPFASITSENFDESVMSAVLLTEEEKNGKKHTESPLERVLMM
jgi:hypothetical protein